MMLCDKRNRFLFEVRPDLFPLALLSTLELEMWSLYYEERERMRPKRG